MQQQLQQALAAQQRQDFDRAEALFLELLNASNGHPVIQAHYATLLCQTKRARQALPFLQGAIDGLPGEAGLLQQAVQIALQLSEHELAESWLKKLISVAGEQEPLLEQLAGVEVALHREQEAIQVLKRVLRVNPKNANALNLKGLALCRLGDVEKGYKSFQKAAQYNPGNLAAVRNLITYGKGKKEPLLEQIVPQLHQKLAQPGLDATARMNIGYVVAMFYEKTQPEASFDALQVANRINREHYQYSHQQTLSQFQVLADAFDAEFIAASHDKALSEESPIFILGMPRSGTTLIEQIISSHSLVGAEGEIEDLRKSFEMQGEQLFKPTPLQARITAGRKVLDGYLNAVRDRQRARYFTDKMPYNFMLIGLIASLMPNAKIIHCTRDSLETCFSIFKQNFSGSHAYSNDLTELGQYFNAYQSLMAIWTERFPNQIYEANYEALIADAENETRKLLAFCGLEMEPACLAFHKNKRAVRTASVAQVRQPLYKTAMKNTEPYRDRLSPLIDILKSGEGGNVINRS
ncbi:MAG: sulfotransferase [Oleiphilaceae bacterium]|nr:sulfotransferase [Oleiphilaceae bacterium]